MRVDPGEEIINKASVDRRFQRKVDRITRILALILAGLSTYAFIFKIVFF